MAQPDIYAGITDEPKDIYAGIVTPAKSVQAAPKDIYAGITDTAKTSAQARGEYTPPQPGSKAPNVPNVPLAQNPLLRDNVPDAAHVATGKLPLNLPALPKISVPAITQDARANQQYAQDQAQQLRLKKNAEALARAKQNPATNPNYDQYGNSGSNPDWRTSKPDMTSQALGMLQKGAGHALTPPATLAALNPTDRAEIGTRMGAAAGVPVQLAAGAPILAYQIAQPIYDSIRTGTSKPLDDALQSMADALNPFGEGLSPYQRAMNSINLGLTLLGAAHGIGALKSRLGSGMANLHTEMNGLLREDPEIRALAQAHGINPDQVASFVDPKEATSTAASAVKTAASNVAQRNRGDARPLKEPPGIPAKAPQGGPTPETGRPSSISNPLQDAIDEVNANIKKGNDKLVPFADIAEKHGASLEELRKNFYLDPETGIWEPRQAASGSALQPALNGQPYYHGHRDTIGNVSSQKEGAFSRNLFGDGLYLTDDPSVAAKYAKQGTTRVGLHPDTKIVNLEAPTPPEILRRWENAFGVEPGSLEGNQPMAELWKALEHDYPDFGAEGTKEALTQGVIDAGYDGMSHKANDRGGWRRGGNNATNNVVVLLNADRAHTYVNPKPEATIGALKSPIQAETPNAGQVPPTEIPKPVAPDGNTMGLSNASQAPKVEGGPTPETGRSSTLSPEAADAIAKAAARIDQDIRMRSTGENYEPNRAIGDALKPVPDSAANEYQAHGLVKGDYRTVLDDLDRLLTQGPEGDRTFHSGPLKPTEEMRSTGVLNTRTDAPFVLLSERGKGFVPGEPIRTVLVNDTMHHAIPVLSEAYPGVRFVGVDQIPEMFSDPLRSSIDETPKTTGARNAVTEQERSAGGDAPVERQHYTTPAEAHAAGQAAVTSGGVDHLALAKEVANNPRPLTAKEVGVLTEGRRLIHNEVNATGAALDAAIHAGSPDVSKLQADYEAAKAKRDLNDQALVKGGREQSAAFLARTMGTELDTGNYSEVASEARRTKGAELTPKEDAQAKARAAQVSALEKRVAELEAKHAQLEAAKLVNKTRAQAQREMVSSAARGERNRIVTEDDYNKALKDLAPSSLNAGVNPKQFAALAKVATYHLERGARTAAEVAKLLVTHAQAAGLELSELDAHRAVMEGARAYGRRLNQGRGFGQDIQTSGRAGIQSAEVMQARKALDLAKAQAQDFIESRRPKTLGEKFGRLQQANILSSPTVFSKLAAATAGHAAISPFEELIGHVIGKIMPGLRERAGTELRGSARAEAKAVAEFFKFATYKDAAQKLFSGHNSLNARAVAEGLTKGGENGGNRILQLIRNAHGAVKTPLQRSAFEREYAKIMEGYQRTGRAVDDNARSEAFASAYAKSQQAVLMNDSAATKWLSNLINGPRRNGAGGDLAAAGLKALMPIAKVPMNYAGRSLEYQFGLPYAAVKSLIHRGSLTPEEAGAVARALKRGGAGAALMVAGSLDHRLEVDKKENLVISGHVIPTAIAHIPWIQALKMGVIFRQQHGSIPDRVQQAASKGLTDTVSKTPVFDTAKEITFAAMSPKGLSKGAGALARAVTIPQPLQQFARGQDTAKDRKVGGFADELKYGLPGKRFLGLPARESLPAK